MNKKQRKYLIRTILVLVVAVVLFWWLSNGEENGQPTTQIETVLIERGDINRAVATSGAVRPLITVEVGSQLSGQVAEIYADFNTPVSKDQVIALIDTKSFESRVLQNRADLEVADSNVVVQRAGIDRATANLRRAKLEFERAEPLTSKGTLSVAEYDTALAGFESAKADLVMAKAQLQNATATRQQRAASLESAEIDLERTRIRSPIDGVVIERAVDQGQTVAASLSSPVLFRIAQDLTEIQIEANVDEADIGNVKEGNEVMFSVDAYPDAEFKGRVNQVRLAPNEQNNVVTYTVIITARNPERKLLPGMTAIVEIMTGKSEGVLRVANEAVRFKPVPGTELARLAEEAPGGAEAHGGRSGGGGMRDVDQLSETLGLNPQQKSAIQTEMDGLRAEMRDRGRGGGQQAGGDNNGDQRQRMQQMREQVRQRFTAVFEKHLTPAQFAEYQQIQRQAAETRPGQIWIQSEDGEIAPVNVRLGISDDSNTQLISRNLEEGQRVVTRIRTAR